MRFKRYLAVVGCAMLLGAAAPSVRAAPTEQGPIPWAYGTPEAGLLAAVQQVLPPQLLQQTPLQLMAVDNNTYVVSHPNLFWPMSQMAVADATAQQLASFTPGWSTNVTNGPQGYGVYLSYQPVTYGTAQAGLLPAVQQLVPTQLLQQTPLQLVPMDNSAYVVSHPNLFWPVSQMGIAQAQAQQLASLTPGWSTSVTNGPQGYGVYLTYQPAFTGTGQAGLLPAVQQIVPTQLLQQTPLQLMPIDNNTFVVSHPNLFWPMDQMGIAEATAQQMASLAPGWSTNVTNGPQGYGIYLTYQPVTYGTTQTGLMASIQQVVPPQVLQQTPLQFVSLDTNTYAVSHPNLFWPVNQMGVAQAQAQRLASFAPGWSTTVMNGPQGYGVYLTYQTLA